MIVSPLQQLPTADALLNGFAQPPAVGSLPLGDGAFSAWLAATVAPTTTPPQIGAAETPLPGETVQLPIPEGTAADDGIVGPVSGTDVPPQAGPQANQSGAPKQDAILNAPNQPLVPNHPAVKVAVAPVPESIGALGKDLSGGSLTESQSAKNATTNPAAIGTTANSASVLTAKLAELPGASLAQTVVGQTIAQHSNNAKPSAPNASSLAANAQNIDGAAPLTDPALQSSSTNNSNSTASLPVVSGATRDGAKAASQGSQTARGSLNTTINTADIAVQMARHKADGSNQFTIRLSPESMGTVTIRLNVGNNSQLSAQMQVEKPETLALLQKDLAGLEKALKAQGFNTSSNDISIALKSATTAMRMGDVMGESLGDQRPGQGQNGSQNQPAAQASQNSSTSNGQSAGGQNVNTQTAQSGPLDRGAAGNTTPSGDMGGFQQSSQGRGEQSQMASDQGFQGHPDAMDSDELDPAAQEILETITSAYQASNLRVGMSSQVDLSI